MKRIEWVDWGKSLAIFSVVLLHTHCMEMATIYIKGFAMPLFFFISGFLFSYERNPEYLPFVKKRFRQIVVPYLWINIITYLIWVFALRHFGTNEHDALEWYQPLVAIFVGWPSLLIHDVPTWSLLAFFAAEVLFYPLTRCLKGKAQYTGLMALAMVAVLYYTVPSEVMEFIPFALGPAIMGLVYYSLGYFCRQTGLLVSNTSIWVDSALFLTAATALYYIAALNGYTMFFMYAFGNLWLFIVGGILGIISFVSLGKLLGHMGDPQIVRFISGGTLLICGFHMLMFALIKGMAWFGLGIDPDTLTPGIWRGLLFSMAALLLCLPIIYFIKRYARFLIDK